MSFLEYSSDQTFWEPVQVPKISKVVECFSANEQIVDGRIVEYLPPSIRDILIDAMKIGASGNGFCFLNACLYKSFICACITIWSFYSSFY